MGDNGVSSELSIMIVNSTREIFDLKDEISKIERAQEKFNTVKNDLASLIERWKSQQYTYNYNKDLGAVVKKNLFEGNVADKFKEEFRERVTEMNEKFEQMRRFQKYLDEQISMNENRINAINAKISTLNSNIESMMNMQRLENGNN